MLGWEGVSKGLCDMSLLPEADGNKSFLAKEASSPVSQHSSRGGGRMAAPQRS